MPAIVPQRRPAARKARAGRAMMRAGPGRDAMLVWWIGAVAIAAVAAAVFVFNDLVAARNQVRAAWSDIDVQLTRRHDLVPQLVAAVQGYASYERATLATVTELRTRAVSAASLADKAEVEGELGRQIDRILALQERYPDLKASDSFLALQRELVEIEDHLQYARRFYNGAVRDLNTRIETFPTLIIARALAFRPAEFFRSGTDQEAPA
jgi:LemA protein